MKKIWNVRGIPRKKRESMPFRRMSLLFCCMMFVLTVFAQMPQIRVSRFSVQNSTLKEAIKQLEKEVATGFFYESKEVERVKGISLTMQNTTLENVLIRLLTGTGFTFEYVDGNVVITRVKQPVVSGPESVQTIRVVVTDAQTGERVTGATAVVRGTTQGGVTDLNGEVELKNIMPNVTIDIRYIGKKTSAFKVVKGKTSYAMELEDDAVVMEGLVVTTGYQTIERGRATGSFNIL